MNRFNIKRIDRFQFFTIPKALFTHKKYQGLNINAKMIYALFLDKVSLSKRNGWIDQNGDIFFMFKQSKIAEYLGLSHATVERALKSLKEVGLYESVRQELGKPSKLYLYELEPAEKAEDVVEVPDNDLSAEDPERAMRDKQYEEMLRAEEEEYAVPSNLGVPFPQIEDTVPSNFTTSSPQNKDTVPSNLGVPSPQKLGSPSPQIWGTNNTDNISYIESNNKTDLNDPEINDLECECVSENKESSNLKKSDNKNNTPTPTPTHKNEKTAYGEFGNVFLDDVELDKLKTQYPEKWEEYIERVSEYCAATGKKYKNYLATIRIWIRKDENEVQAVRNVPAPAKFYKNQYIQEEQEVRDEHQIIADMEKFYAERERWRNYGCE